MGDLLRSALLLLGSVLAGAAPWDLRSYELCRSIRLRGIPAETSGVTFNPITNTVWVVTRRPRVLGEYSLEGEHIRSVDTSHARLRDPEGVTWMYDYIFAIAQEGSTGGYRYSSISIVDASPWRDEVDIIRRIEVKIKQRKNAGLEAVTYDPIEKVLIAGQEEDPMQLWAVDPENGDSKKIYTKATESKLMRDFASVYKRAGDDGIYILSEPSERVFRLDEDGRRVDGQVILVKGQMPEGVTFTPDGHMMVIAGEPNEMFVYSSTGSCKYRPDPNLKVERPAGSSSSEADHSSSALSAPIVTEGFCSYSECVGGAQGTDWCKADAHRCVGSCGGWWCSKIQGVPPITPSNYIGPPPPLPSINPPPPSPPRSPPSPAWHTDPDNGFCNFNACEKGPGGEEWCKSSIENCLRCEGTWCPIGGIDAEPLTKKNFKIPEPTKTQSPPPTTAGKATPPQAQDLPDGGVGEGFKAFMDIIVDGMGSLSPDEVAGLRQAVALDLFGAAQAEVAVNASVQSDTRRLLSEGSAPAATRLAVEVLAQTPEHANYLRQKFEAAVGSGSLVNIMHNNYGFELVEDVVVQDSKVVLADIRPSEYPTAVTTPTPYDQIPVVYMMSEQSAASAVNWTMVGGVAAGAIVLALIAAIVMNAHVIRKRAPSCLQTTDAAGAVAARVRLVFPDCHWAPAVRRPRCVSLRP